jgi:hypothetical protein
LAINIKKQIHHFLKDYFLLIVCKSQLFYFSAAEMIIKKILHFDIFKIKKIKMIKNKILFLQSSNQTSIDIF